MLWAHMLAYVPGMVDQELLLVFEEGGPTFSRPKGDRRTRNALSRKQEKSAMHTRPEVNWR
jgi:hypothetical protein